MKNIALHYDYKHHLDVDVRKGAHKDGKPYIVVDIYDYEGYLSLFLNHEQAKTLRDALSAVIEQEVKA